MAISLWVDTAPETSFPRLEGSLDVDVAVIGGGVVGLTAAVLLKRAGVRVAVVEAGRVGTGVTGHTTGKVSSLHRLVYRELRGSLGRRGAQVYGEANQAAIERMARVVAGDGSHVFERSRVSGVEDADRCRVSTRDGSLTAGAVIVE